MIRLKKKTVKTFHALELLVIIISIIFPKSICANSTPQPGDADYPTENKSDRHVQKVAAVKSGEYDLVLIGDSITHTIGELGGKYEPLKAVWDRHFAPRRAINLGHNGFRTENILWNLLNGELDFPRSPKVAMILIGTNNTDERHFPRVHTPEQIFAGTKAIVDLIRKRHPSTKILLLRIFPRGGDDEKGISPPAFNSSAQCIETCRRAGELTAKLADNEHVFWLDVNYVFFRPDGTINTELMWDLLHPGPAGTKAWVQAVEPTVAMLMGDNPIVSDNQNSAIIPAPKLEEDGYDWLGRHQEIVNIQKDIDPELVFIGDSITHAWGGEPLTGARKAGEKVFNSEFGRYRKLNLGFGWDRIQNVLWRLDHGELDGTRPKTVVIHIGTNNTSDTKNARPNTPAEIVDGIRQIILRLRAKVPKTHIILMSVFPREEKPGHARRKQINEINHLLASEFNAVKGITCIDIGPKLLQPDGTIAHQTMSDFCHPTERGYKIWADAILPYIQQN